MANIFEFLGIDSNHRTGDKITQKVKHIDEVPASKKFDDYYLAQVKKDGVFCHVVKKSELDIAFFSRTGKQFSCTDYLLNHLVSFGESIEPGVYMTELCCDSCSLEALSGIFNPNRKKILSDEQHEWCKDSYLAFYDYVPLKDFVYGQSIDTAEDRYDVMISDLPVGLNIIPSKVIEGKEAIEEFAYARILEGEEGAVFKRCSSIWVAGHKGYRSMKIVRGIDYDLECIGVEEGTGKYAGKVANLLFRWKNGKTIKAMLGKGWTHEDAEEMYHRYNGFADPGYPVGQIFKVYALQESSKGKLRLPKAGCIRFDKVKADV